jgi:hypothetical protein
VVRLHCRGGFLWVGSDYGWTEVTGNSWIWVNLFTQASNEYEKAGQLIVYTKSNLILQTYFSTM